MASALCSVFVSANTQYAGNAMSLTKYRMKRHFNSTPEPTGGKPATDTTLQFVVQKHAASHLHFDFRLELDGVLKSWAVPKGPSMDPADKRLAIMVEDHPLDYGTFEGTIPSGNYGAGTVMVWDKGTYAPREAVKRDDAEQVIRDGLERGHLSVVLGGSKLRGEFSLLKLTRGKPNEWLLVKKNDEFATTGGNADDKSAVSGRNMEQISSGKPTSRKKSAATKRTPKPVVQPSEKRAEKMIVRPMLATLVDQAFDREGWLFEVKWDGFRAIAELDHGDVLLYSRNHKSFNDRFSPIVETLTKMKSAAVLDGEIVILDRQGKSQFQLLQNYQTTGEGQLVYYVFDLLFLDGKDLRNEPLRERKKALAKLIKGKKNVLLSEHIETTGLSFFEAAANQQLEGIIAKNAESRYREGVRNLDWLKIKTQMRQEAVVGGFTEPKGGRQEFGALVLGVYDGKDLNYIGHTGGGFDASSLSAVRSRLEPLVQKACPFNVRPHTNTPAQWVKPELVCEVKFSEWTKDGSMRQPIFLGLRDDKKATTVHREVKAPVEDVLDDASETTKVAPPVRQRRAAAPKATSSEPEFHLTHPDKVYWPDDGYTKADLFNYYREAAAIILPYLRDRPQSMHRFPNGIDGQSFFQKDVSRQPPPAEVKTATIKAEGKGKTIEMPLCQDEASLLYLANLGCIELNPWNSRLKAIDRPDYMVIDLDPEDVPFERVVETAMAVHKVLEKAGCASYCKTSGKRGLHIYVPLGAHYDYAHVRQFAEIVANVVHNRIPDFTSVVRSPAKRQHKVYLDYLQNSRGATVAAPYSVRPYRGATVSTPLKWQEVTRRLDPGKFTIRTVPKRLDKVGDLWQPVLGDGIDLEESLKRLTSGL